MHKTKAEILTIGDEILYGQIVDTNSQWMSRELDNAGIKTTRKTTVGDSREAIISAFKEAEERADIVLITGGLGPTNDDLTKPCLAAYFDSEITINPKALEEVSEFFTSKGFPLSEVNRNQAALPACCEMISNKIGTAPGMWFQRKGKVFVSMPGIPREMKMMMADTVIPRLCQTFDTDVVYHKIIKTIGIGESWLAEKIADWERNLPDHISLAYLPELGQVKLRLTAVGDDLKALESEIASLIEMLHAVAGKYIYGYDNEQIEEVVGKLFIKYNKTLALAESCTGGYVSHLITSVAGCSFYLQGAMVPYHNEHKVHILGVNGKTIEAHGAVSEETIGEMANKVRGIFKSDIGVATSGIAGPTGGTAEKPVGTVWIAYADGKQTITRKLQLWKDREINIKASANALLNLIRISLPKTIEIKE